MSSTSSLLKLLTPEQIAQEAAGWLVEYEGRSDELLSKEFVSTEEKVMEIVSKYRQLPPQKPRTFKIPENVADVAKMIVNVRNLTCHPFHLGHPMKENEKAEFHVSHKLNKKYGEVFELRIYKCFQDTNEFTLISVSQKRIISDSEEFSATLNITDLIENCQSSDKTVLHIFIEGKYYSEGSKKKPIFLSRCVELWSEECGISFSGTQSISTWPVGSQDSRLMEYGSLFDAMPASSQISDMKLDVCVLSPDFPPPPIPYDFETNSTAHYKYRLRKHPDQNYREETEAAYLKYVKEITELLEAKKINYKPSMNSIFVDLGCIICKEKFDTVLELILHLYISYPELNFKIQRQPNSNGNSDIVIHLFASESDNKRVLQDTEFDIHDLLMRAFSSVNFFQPEGQLSLQLLDDYHKCENYKVICSECRMTPRAWIAYSSGMSTIDFVLNMEELPFNEKFFYTCFQSFVVHSQIIPIFREWDFSMEHRSLVEKIYLLLRCFILTHSAIFKNNTVNFLESFENLIEHKIQEIFHLNDEFPLLFKADLKSRASMGESHYLKLTSDKAFVAIHLDNAKFHKKYGFSTPFLSGPIPKTIEERRRVLETISTDPSTLEMFPHFIIYKENLDFIHIPRCLFFGAERSMKR